MPVISMFYGIIISMYFMDNKKHKKPHIHVTFQGKEAVYEIPSGEVLEGGFPETKQSLSKRGS